MLGQEYNPLISIIIPIYNTSKYLEQCLSSIVSQDYTNIEIICINDCSTDNSLDILKRFFKKDNRIIILNNKENLGAGISRNIGIEHSNGDYIFFLDADDWLEKNAFSILVKYLNLYNTTDFIQYGINYISPTFKLRLEKLSFPENYANRPVNIQENSEIFKYIDYKIKVLINSKLLKANKILFNNNKTLEDVEFTLNLIKYAKIIILANDLIYNYRVSVKNSVSSKIPEYFEYNINFLQTAKICVEEYSKNAQEIIFSNLYKLFMQNMVNSYFSKKINYSELNAIIKSNLDYNTLKTYSGKYYVNLYDAICGCSEKEFVRKYYIKYIIKNNFSVIFLLYMKIKQYLIKPLKAV